MSRNGFRYLLAILRKISQSCDDDVVILRVTSYHQTFPYCPISHGATCIISHLFFIPPTEKTVRFQNQRFATRYARKWATSLLRRGTPQKSMSSSFHSFCLHFYYQHIGFTISLKQQILTNHGYNPFEIANKHGNGY